MCEQRLSHEYETACRVDGFTLIAGVDEAGRGSTAGPVVAAAVVLPAECCIEGLNDSKQLTPLAREECYCCVTAVAVGIGIGHATVSEIDEMNILNATFLAMRRALRELPCGFDFVLVDGNMRIRGLAECQRPIIDGDALSVSVAAASVIAKVTRDRMMVELHQQYPEFGFDVHKGYHTPLHAERLAAYGATPVHRRSFAPIAEVLGLERDGQCRLPIH